MTLINLCSFRKSTDVNTYETTRIQEIDSLRCSIEMAAYRNSTSMDTFSVCLSFVALPELRFT